MYEILFYCDNFELNQVDSISALIRETYANKLPRDLFRASIKENTKKKTTLMRTRRTWITFSFNDKGDRGLRILVLRYGNVFVYSGARLLRSRKSSIFTRRAVIG